MHNAGKWERREVVSRGCDPFALLRGYFVATGIDREALRGAPGVVWHHHLEWIRDNRQDVDTRDLERMTEDGMRLISVAISCYAVRDALTTMS